MLESIGPMPNEWISLLEVSDDVDSPVSALVYAVIECVDGVLSSAANVLTNCPLWTSPVMLEYSWWVRRVPETVKKRPHALTATQ